MQPISYDRHRFPPEVIRYAIWLYARFTLSYRDVEELVAERGLDVSYETIRDGCSSSGRLSPATCAGCDPGLPIRGTWTRWSSRSGAGACTCGEPSTARARLDLLVQPKRDKAAALRLMRKLLSKHGYAPRVLVTDRLRSCGAARRHLGLAARHEQGLRKNNRADNRLGPPRSARRRASSGSEAALPARLRAERRALMPGRSSCRAAPPQ
jgi:putative transposase